MNKRNCVIVLLLVLIVLAGCNRETGVPNLSSTPVGTTSAASPTAPADPCSKGHNFTGNADTCSVCGADYFSVTLEFQLNDTEDGYIVSDVGTCGRTEVIVPAQHKGLPVTEIGRGAFSVCDWIEKVALPDSVTKIGDKAFNGCEKLAEVVLSEQLTYIGQSAFYMCALTEIVIPEKVTCLGTAAFACCPNLQQISLPDGITEMGEELFMDCPSLKSIYIPKGVTVIPNSFAIQCTALETVEIGGEITTIGDSAFCGCEKLAEVVLPEQLTYIGQSAFYMCAFTEIVIPEKVTCLGAAAFGYCPNLQQISLPDGITEMGEELFIACHSLKEIYIPKGVAVIPNSFALLCIALETVEIGGEITTIGETAFSGCVNLKSINLGDKLEYIGPGTFGGCCALEELMLPGSVKEIHEQAFSGCASLTKLNIPNGLEKLGDEITAGCDKLEYNIYQGMRYLGNAENPYLILVGRSDPDQKHLIVHEDTRFIPDNETFSGTDIQTIYIGKSVAHIGPYHLSDEGEGYWEGRPFSNMDALESIEVSPENKTYHASGNCLIETAAKTLVQGCKNSVIPDDGSVETIGSFAFAYLDTLTSLVIPDSVKVIGAHAFGNCVNMQWLVIGSGVEKIERVILWAVNGVSVFYMGSEADWEKIQIVGINVSSGMESNRHLKNAPRYFYAETGPADEVNYWHFVDGVPTPWKTKE